MKLSNRAKIGILFVGDVVALYAALFLALVLRYGISFYAEFAARHVGPFSAVFALWLLIFYIAGLYDLPRLRNNIDFVKTLGVTTITNVLLTVALFYFIPTLGIAPKTNLFLFIAIFAVLEVWWRRTFNVRASFREGLHRVLLADEGMLADEIVAELSRNPQVGYEATLRFQRGIATANAERLRDLITTNDINTVVVPHTIKRNPKLSRMFYELLASGTEVIDTPAFYELVFRKVPLSALDETWFLEHRIGQRKFFDELKRGLECIAMFAASILLLPVLTAIAIAVKTTSRGPAIYKQVRVGKHGKKFVLYKFRTMRRDAEENGPTWASTRDPRQTLIGGFLRYTHLDELPQLVNILKGELSIVGPRPERPEFVETLKEKIPFYETRLLVPPGVTGWAQINYRYAASEEDAAAKLEYDIYYLKNRSLVLDLTIILKTLKLVFVNHK